MKRGEREREEKGKEGSEHSSIAFSISECVATSYTTKYHLLISSHEVSNLISQLGCQNVSIL